jgi:penicillin G amidase
MKTVRFLILLFITVGIGISLNVQIGSTPPLGKLLSPFHGFLQNIEKPKNDESQLNVTGLLEPVDVYVDEMSIPHIYAKNDHDLYFAQGYLTAKDRLWQMDFFSRVVLGRLSEVLGEKALNYDRLNRRIGLKKMTESLWVNIQKDPILTNALSAYSDGVNAYIETLDYADYPIEFKLLNYDPEPWSPTKSCLAYAMLSNTLSSSEADLENTNARTLFGEEMYKTLFPEQLGNLDPIIPSGTKWEFTPKQSNDTFTHILQTTTNTIEKPDPLYGSNNFVAAGSKTQNGNVIFANEPDLQLTHPSIWYAVHQHTPEINTMGVTVPGTPVLLIGFNDSITWGVTNSPRDQVDWYAIKFKNASRNEYWYNNQWFKTEKVIEKFSVKQGQDFYDTIIYVHHGPVVYDRNYFGENEKNNYAMRWIAHKTAGTFTAMYNVNRAQNYDQFTDALKSFTGPPQNFLFGSTSGDIGIILPGTFPIKPKGKGQFLLDGTLVENEWNTMIPYEHRLTTKNPKSGFLSSANQHPVDSLYPYYVYDHHYEYYRNRRINDRLKLMTNITEKDFMTLQNDNYNYQASESLPSMLTSIDSSTLTVSQSQFYSALKNWDYFNLPEKSEPTLYQIWWDILYKQIWDEFDTTKIAINKPNIYTTIHLLKTQPELVFFDHLETKATENANALYLNSFKLAVDSLANWKLTNGEDDSWYLYKNTTIRHLLRLPVFSESKIKIGGGKGIVNAATAQTGPSWRMVVELDPAGTKAWAIYPGSQTGNPASTKYGEFSERWASGKYEQLLFGQDVRNSDRIKEKIIFINK